MLGSIPSISDSVGVGLQDIDVFQKRKEEGVFLHIGSGEGASGCQNAGVSGARGAAAAGRVRSASFSNQLPAGARAGQSRKQK